jgi:hypothetical protein
LNVLLSLNFQHPDIVARTYNPLFLTFCLHIYFQSNFFIISSLFHQFNLFMSIFISLMLTATCMCRPYKSRKSRKIVKPDNLTNFGSRNRKSKFCFISPMFEWYEVYIINVWAKCCEQKVCMIIEKMTSSQKYRRRRLKRKIFFFLFDIDINVIMNNGQRRITTNGNNLYDLLMGWTKISVSTIYSPTI